MYNKTNQKGFSIFVAMIVTSVLLIVAFSVASVASKQISIATTNTESEYAYFAADSGMECALYWDTKVSPSAFSTSTPSSLSCVGTFMITGRVIIGTSTLAFLGGGGDANNTSIFGFSLNSATNPSTECAIVTVSKFYSGGNLVTDVFSHGYNNCDTSDPRRVERGIEVKY